MHGVTPCDIEMALSMAHEYTWVDVRSENEYQKAHIPNAINVPILNNEDRIAVGTCYKEKGRVDAVRLGLERVGPRFKEIYDRLLSLYQINEKPLLFYCWRGGLRSQIASSLMHWAGERVSIVIGGYKSYRNWALTQFEKKYPFIVLSGSTGSGKTQLLLELQNQDLQVLDLEGLANHKGSVLGGIGKSEQPSNEQFENQIAFQLFRFSKNQPILVENESKRIGRCILPDSIWKNMQEVKAIEILVDKATRIQRLHNEYAHLPVDELKEQTLKLRKRLGGQHEKQAQLALDSNDFLGWIQILLVYYDKAYFNYQVMFNHQLTSLEVQWDGENKNQINEASLMNLIQLINHEFNK